MARIAGIDIPREKRVEIALTYIYGIGLTRSKLILSNTGVNPDIRVKDLSDSDVQKLGGLWVDYHLMSNIGGLFVLGEANYSVHGANRLGANALLQCLCDGYFISPKTITSWLANNELIDKRKIDEAKKLNMCNAVCVNIDFRLI